MQLLTALALATVATGTRQPRLTALSADLGSVLPDRAAVTISGPSDVWGEDVGVRLTETNGEIVETWLAKDAQGKTRTVLSTPTAEGLPLSKGPRVPTALRESTSSRLFSEAPTLRFTKSAINTGPGGTKTIVLVSESDRVLMVKRITVPAKGHKLRIEMTTTFRSGKPLLEYLLLSYAFTPDGQRTSVAGLPDSTFSPGLRKNDNEVVGDHFFRCPAVSAQKGTLAAIVLPDVEVLAENRPMPTIVDLDCRNGVVDAPLLSYGFCDHKVVSHVAYAHDPSMLRRVPKELELAMDVIVTAKAVPFGAFQLAADETWKTGERYFDKILPQAMPFADYAKVCYPAAFAERQGNNVLGWFETEIDGKPCGGVMAGWGYQQGWVSWQPWFNNLRSAWGMRWWGRKLGEPDWVQKADKMLNLALAAPMKQGACPTTYQSREKTWKGSLIMPRKDCYYDLTNMAWKGVWMLEWLKFDDCPRRDDIDRQCREMADCMVRFQNADGSFPTWLTQDLKVVPVLDHSAQSALPAWFLFAYAERHKEQARYREAALRAADFLVKHVVDKQLYYDFETFFSCSPKTCLQADGKIDDLAMWDRHTMSPPQNTLSMHWAAEALRLAGNATRNAKYHTYALRALDMMNLYQNVWPISYRKTAYTYGGFGVQNSDGEYNDARQAQFGTTLCDFGMQFGRKDYFQRGVAATRAAMTLINHPLHAEFGIYPNPNYPLGLQPENCCHGGGDHQAGRTGFDWGEGSGLTSMAYLLDAYGPTAKGKDWTVLVDGGSRGIEMLKASTPPLPVDPVFDFADWRMKGWTVVGDFAEVPTSSTRFDFGNAGRPFIGTCEDGTGGYDDAYTGSLLSPNFKVSKPKMSLLVGGGKGNGVFVELIDASTGKRIYVERGRDAEKMDRRTWDVSRLKDTVLQLRIVDDERGGWGHINVGDVRFE
ncbi:MAG: hypothetical protein JST30_15415 [Armatimonadetes bacterium]|nr:hypothetical protein [Armatimonadota bacterium]